jgi:4-amino-4-deoxy-L-arabinose transferase-like glycosyltransferase
VTGKADARGALLWGVAGAAACAAMAPLQPSVLEEGGMLHLAQRMNGGERLFVDLLSVTGPVPYVLLSLLFRVFGEEVYTARLALAALHGLSTAAAFDIARRGRAGALAHGAAALWASAPILLFPSYSIYFYATVAVHVALLATWTALRAPASLGWALAAGAGAAVVALSKQTLGVALAAGFLVAVPLAAAPGRRLRQALGVAAGGAGLALVSVAYYTARGELAALVENLVRVPLSYTASYVSPLPNLWPPGRFVGATLSLAGIYLPNVYIVSPEAMGSHGPPAWLVALTQLLFALPFAALAATAWLAWRRRLEPCAGLHAALLFALATNLFPRSDWGHLVVSLPAAGVQLLLLTAPRLPAARRAVAAWWVVLPLAVGALVLGVGLHRWAWPEGFGPRVPQRQVGGRDPELGAAGAAAFLSEHVEPGEAIFVARSEPLIYFATGTTNPTPYSGVVPALREEQERTILAALRSLRFVVMSDYDSPTWVVYREELPHVQAYLERHFRVAAPFARSPRRPVYVLERGPDRGRLAIDLAERAGRARRWTRDAGGRLVASVSPVPRLATTRHQRPLGFRTAARGGGLDFDLEVPEGGVFLGAGGEWAVRSDAGLHVQTRPGRLVASLRPPGGRFEELASLPVGSYEEPTWREVSADLARFAGQAVTLRLELRTGSGGRDGGGLAWWGSPRIVVPPGRGAVRTSPPPAP